MHANRFTNRFMNRFALFTSPHVNRVNGFRIDSRAHDMKSNDLNACGWIHESIRVCNRTHSLMLTYVVSTTLYNRIVTVSHIAMKRVFGLDRTTPTY